MLLNRLLHIVVVGAVEFDTVEIHQLDPELHRRELHKIDSPQS